MGFFDWFEPDPPLRCLKCKSGVIHGWQEKHSGHGLFQWRQGVASPVDQLVDEECKIDEHQRAAKRLPKDEGLEIYYGDCDHCGATFPFHLRLKFSGDTWIGFDESDRVRYATEIEANWLQCPACLDAYKLEDGQRMTVCPKCDLLLLAPDPQDQQDAEQDVDPNA